MFILTLALVLLVVYLSVNVTKVVLHNYQAHKFFQTRSPRLPILSKPNILFGNIDQTTWNEKNYELIDRLHNELGETFGYYFMSQPWVSTKDIDLIKKIELDDANKHLDRAFLGFPMNEFNTSIFQINGDRWRQVRKAMSPSLTNHKVRSDQVSSGIQHVLRQFVRALERKLDTVEYSEDGRSVILDVHNYAQRITMAVIFTVVYQREGEIDFDAIEEYWTSSTKKTEKMVLHPAVKLSAALPFLAPILSWAMRFNLMGQMNMRVNDYIDTYLKTYQATRRGQQDYKRKMLDGLIDAFVERKINKEQYVGSANFLLLAGYETTAATISCLLWQLVRHIDIQTKLREAIMNEGLNADYVVWCIMETIRWHPPVPLGVGRVIGEDITTNDGLFLAKGTFVMPSIYSIHHDESIWPEHDKFIPERWQCSSKLHPAAFMGFGLGPRNCVGGKMAIHEIKLVLSAILPRYKLTQCEATPDQYNFASPGMIYTIPDEKVKIRFTRLD